MPEPVGQFKTRRGPLGRIEKIPEAEQAGLIAGATAGKAPPVDPEDPFLTAFREKFQAPPAAPPAAGVAAVATVAPKSAAATMAGQAVPKAAAAAGAAPAAAGGLLAAATSPAGVGAATAYLAGKAILGHEFKTHPVGVPGAGPGRSDGGESERLLQSLVSIQKQIARVGSPVKGAVATVASDSRL